MNGLFAIFGWATVAIVVVLDLRDHARLKGKLELSQEAVTRLDEENWELQDANAAYSKLVDKLRDTIDDKDAEILKLMAKVPKRGADGKWSKR